MCFSISSCTVTCSFALNPAYPLRILCFLLLFPHFQPLLILSAAARATWCTHVPVCSLFSIVLLASTRPCRCVPVHLLRICIPFYLALVAWPSFITRGQSKHAQVRHCRSRSGHGHDLRHALNSPSSWILMSAHARSSDRAPPALRTTRTRSPCDPCPSFGTLCTDLSDPTMTSGSLLPVMCLISSRADLGLKSQCHVECSGRRNRHAVQCVVLDIRDPHCFLTVSVQCLLRGDS